MTKPQFSAKALRKLWDDLHKTPPLEELVCTDGRVHGARYYCVEPVGGSWKDMESWALVTYGEPGEFWSAVDFAWPESPRWFVNNRKFWFRDEADRILFVMKWH